MRAPASSLALRMHCAQRGGGRSGSLLIAVNLMWTRWRTLALSLGSSKPEILRAEVHVRARAHDVGLLH